MFLEVQSISKNFPGVRALQDVSIDLRGGEIHAVVGENGAGKSTLMNILIGALKPDTGNILLDGKKVTLHRPLDAQRLGIAIVPQEINLVPMLTVTENVYLGIEPRKAGRFLLDRKAAERLTLEAIARIGEDIDPREKVSDLSTAQKQLVQIARAFAFGAKVLILDEPTASLTIRESDNLFKIVRAHQASGGSIFYISHRLGEIKEIADRISVLRDGVKVAELDAHTASIGDMIGHMVVNMATKSTEGARKIGKSTPVVLKVDKLTRPGEFSDISFELHEGEILGIAGLVGSGRTEIVKCIFGDTQPHSGSIFMGGKKVLIRSPIQGIKNGIAYVPEERRRLGIFPILSVKENMTLPILRRITTLFGINKRKEKGYARGYVSKLKIKTMNLGENVRNLSGGNQQKVILARWMLKGCKVLILDEPTRGVDVNAKTEIHNLLREITGEGISVILISSELEEVIENTDRILILHEGRIKGHVDPWETTQEEIMNICLT
ncbi:MAG: sugar ABC transporter ATP-binding protein [Rectinemataceae bacterium]|jgi:ABC-type sugar transport system ATPase subunit